MRAHAANERRGEQQLVLAVEKDVHGFAQAGEMAAFGEHGATEARVQFSRRCSQVFDGREFAPEQQFGFVQVRRDERSQRQQVAGERADGARLQQNCAAGGDHHRVHDERRARAVAEGFHHGANDGGGKQHAGLDRGGGKLGADGGDLLADNGWPRRLDAGDARGVLRGEASDGAGAVDAESGEGFQVGLNARAAAAVGAGDGEGDGEDLSGRHGGVGVGLVSR